MKKTFELKKGEKPIILTIGAVNAPFDYIKITRNGKEFYDRKFFTKKVEHDVKIPISGYYEIISQGTYIRNIKPFVNKIDLSDLPLFEKGTNNLIKPIIARGANINNSPACIGVREYYCDLVFNTKFNYLPIYAKIFVIFHELAHRLYNREDYCDEYALKHCLARGWNKTQMFYALSRVLKYSKANIKRLNSIVNLISKED